MPHLKTKKSRAKKGVSTVFGTLLFMILIFTISSVLFLGLYRFNTAIQEANTIEDKRLQERIVLSDIKLVEGNIVGINITNSGSTTVQIKAFYVNNAYVCDPSDPILNPNGAYVNSQDSELINVTSVPFDPTARIGISTARGIKAIELESKFIIGTNSTAAPPETYYGPLRLNFTLFYYREIDINGVAIGPWREGSHVSPNAKYVAWNLTVTNIDTRGITLSQYSSITLVSNEGGAQYPWYTNYPNQYIGPDQTATIIYIWANPLPSSAAGDIGNSQAYKVFLTFFGKFSDGKDYGQTIPFQAVLKV